MSSSDSITNLEAMIFFCETEFVSFLYTLNVNNNIQFRRFVESKYSWNHLMSRSKIKSYLCTYIALIRKNKYLYFIWKKGTQIYLVIYIFFQACRSWFVQPSRSSRWRNFGTIPRGPILLHCSRTEVIKELKIQTARLLFNFN